MRIRFAVVVVSTVLVAGCQRSFTHEDAVTAIQRHETFHRLLASPTERVAHESVGDCRVVYGSNPGGPEIPADSALILLSGAGWMDLADVDAPSDPRQKKHCRAVLTSKADKTAFKDAQDASASWIVETAHTKLEVFDIPEDGRTRDSAIADFQISQDRTPIGEILHRPRWSEEEARLFTSTVTGHFRHYDDGWRLESFDTKK